MKTTRVWAILYAVAIILMGKLLNIAKVAQDVAFIFGNLFCAFALIVYYEVFAKK
jgi:hypothetical protein